MQITIRPEHEELISPVLHSGAYANADESIGRAVEVLRAEHGWLAVNRTLMESLYQVSAGAQEDLFEIWRRIG